jgi:hypothetical protein
MRHAALEVLCGAPYGVEMMREKVACLAGMGDNIRRVIVRPSVWDSRRS